MMIMILIIIILLKTINSRQSRCSIYTDHIENGLHCLWVSLSVVYSGPDLKNDNRPRCTPSGPWLGSLHIMCLA